jgi:nucleoside phosphorylase
VKRYFDTSIVTPLEEEFEAAVECFEFVEDLSSDDYVRFAVTPPGSDIAVLLIKQQSMGRTSAQQAALNAVREFDIGLFICLGIAGAISDDLKIGDVCYSGTIIDVLDNAKAQQTSDNDESLSFSPTVYSSPTSLSVLLTLNRLTPHTKCQYDAWQKDQEQQAKALIPGEFTGRGGKKEPVSRPRALEGAIACGAVSSAPTYNQKLKAIDRKLLAIETESGGIFGVSTSLQIPALTIRGISDYAGIDKNRFEEETGHQARKIAAKNAATFAACQMASERFTRYFAQARLKRDDQGPELPLPPITPKDPLADVLIRQGEAFDEKLRALAPGYALQSKGYRLPVPRIRPYETRSGVTHDALKAPIEVRDGIKDTRVLVIQVPKEYPDLSLAWIIANDMLSAQIRQQKTVPCVVDATLLRRPRPGIRQLIEPDAIETFSMPEVVPIIVIDNFQIESKSKTDYIKDQISQFPDARFILISRPSHNITLESEFHSSIAASIARICDISFTEIAHFLQKNFELSGPAAEVVATRLRETFNTFDLPAHPNYVAGIPRNILDGLLQANRRAELIELAVAGYLSFVVAEDNEPVALSRKTREQFLSALAFDMNVEKRAFSESEIVTYADEFARRYDFKISPSRFIAAFIKRGILFVEGESVGFSLPFMESYLLAKRLHVDAKAAESYFEITAASFDLNAFSLYAEMGASPGFIDALLKQLDESISALEALGNDELLVLSDRIAPTLTTRPDRVAALQRRLERAANDVRVDRDASHEKQRLLDATDRIREDTARRAQEAQEATPEQAEARRSLEGDATSAWFTGISLLGSGAERLEGTTKRTLISRLLRISALMITDWAKGNSAVDFSDMKRELEGDEKFLDHIASSTQKKDVEEAKTLVDGLVDVLEFSFMAEPIMTVISILCEEARDNVLPESIINTLPSGQLERLIRAVWLADVDTPRGKKIFQDILKELPKTLFLRMCLTTHLMNRVYWKHWKKEDRLVLLDLAEQSIKALGYKYNKSELMRMIEREKKADDKASEL